MNSKIVKLSDSSYTLLPITDANAVQYNNNGSYISVQTAIDNISNQSGLGDNVTTVSVLSDVSYEIGAVVLLEDASQYELDSTFLSYIGTGTRQISISKTYTDVLAEDE